MIDRCGRCKTICSNLDQFIVTPNNETIKCPCLTCIVRPICEDCVFICPHLRDYFCLTETFGEKRNKRNKDNERYRM